MAQAPKKPQGRPRKIKPTPAPKFNLDQFSRDYPDRSVSMDSQDLGVPKGTVQNVSMPEQMDDHQLVVFSLRNILLDAASSPASKASAARTLAEINGQLGKNAKPPQDAGKPLSEMTREELEAELQREM